MANEDNASENAALNPITIVFRNQTGGPVTVVIKGSGGDGATLYSGVLTDASGVYHVSGYAKYSCSGLAARVITPPMKMSTDVTVVFEQYAGVDA